MGYHDFVSEAEAANFAGVSGNTLGRFAEAGYLKIETDQDGLRLYSKSELKELFGISGLDLEVSRLADEEISVAGDASPEAIANEKSEETTYYAEVVSESAPAAVLNESVSEESNWDEPAEAEDTRTIESCQVEQRGPELMQPASSEGHEIELVKLRSIVNLQEKLLDMRDEQLRSLRKENEWLKERIEKQEEKSDRDQLLLLAETQLIRKFITIQTRKSSPLRAALEWIGLVPPQKTDLPAA